MENALHVHTLAYLILLGWQDSLNWSTDTTQSIWKPWLHFSGIYYHHKISNKKMKGVQTRLIIFFKKVGWFKLPDLKTY